MIFSELVRRKAKLTNQASRTTFKWTR